MQPQLDISPERAKAELWRRGDLYWKLHSGQQDIHDLVEKVGKQRQPRGVVRTSRRLGKTFYLCTFATSRCITEPGCQIPFAAPTAKNLVDIVLPQFEVLLRDCPEYLRPTFRSQKGSFEFNNGSRILLFGTDNRRAEKIRGIRANYYIIDEAGFIDDLRELVLSILQPTLMYSDGFGIISSTPPTSPDHYFVELLGECEAKDAAIKKTVWENPLLEEKEILEHAEATGCVVDWNKKTIIKKSVQFRREYEAEILVDPERAVIPDFTEAKAEEVVGPYEMPNFAKKLVAIDTGFVDHTGVVFGFYDFLNAKVVIQDDLLINFANADMDIEKLCNIILAKEQSLWKGERAVRVCDGDLIVLREMAKHGCSVGEVRKDNLEAQVNQARMDVRQDKLRICPEARNVQAHMKYAVWNKRRTQFERTEGRGHYDCLAALIYFLRHIDRHTNPWPENYGVDHFNQVVPETKSRQEELADIFIRR